MNAVVVLPTYNEKGNIERLITLLEEEIFPAIKNYNMFILVADDTSPDGTIDEVKKTMKKWKNIQLSLGEKKGLGAAYVRGMTYAIEKMNADVLFEMDADFFHDPFKIPEFLKKIDEGYDFVVGTRYSGGGSIPKNWAFNRKFLSVVGNFIVRMVFMRFYIHDWTGGYRAIRKEVFIKEKEKLSPFKGYRFQVGFLHKAVADGFKIGEVPFVATDRTLGRSKMARGDTIIDTLQYVFYARFLELQRFIKFLVVGGSGFIIQVVVQEAAIGFGIAIFVTLFLKSFFAISDIKAFSYGVGAAFGAEAAILCNFLFNNFWTFNDTNKIKEGASFWSKLIKFNFASLLSIFVQFFAVWLGDLFIGNNIKIFSYLLPTRILILFPIIIFLVIPLNYFIYNVFIWKTQYLKHEKTS